MVMQGLVNEDVMDSAASRLLPVKAPLPEARQIVHAAPFTFKLAPQGSMSRGGANIERISGSYSKAASSAITETDAPGQVQIPLLGEVQFDERLRLDIIETFITAVSPDGSISLIPFVMRKRAEVPPATPAIAPGDKRHQSAKDCEFEMLVL